MGGENGNAVGLPRQMDVVHIPAGAEQEALVLDAAHRLANTEFGAHFVSLVSNLNKRVD